MRQYAQGDPIRVQADDLGRPASFNWHGEAHHVETIEEVREPRLDWWSATGEVHRRYYLVTTHRGLICEIYRDVAGEAWYLGRMYD